MEIVKTRDARVRQTRAVLVKSSPFAWAVLGKHENRRRSTHIHRKRIRSFIQRTDVSGDDSAGPMFARWRGCEPRCPPPTHSPLCRCLSVSKTEKRTKNTRRKFMSQRRNCEVFLPLFFLPSFLFSLLFYANSLKTPIYFNNMKNWFLRFFLRILEKLNFLSFYICFY